MNKENKQGFQASNSKELDILELFSMLRERRMTLIIILLACITIGLTIAFISPKQYKVVTTMLPQSEESGGMGGLSSLAAIAGFDIDLSDNGTEISPIIYPQIMESEPFLLALMHSKYTFKKVNHPISLYEYTTKYEKPNALSLIVKYTIGLPAIIKKALKSNGKGKLRLANDGLTRLNQDEYNLATTLKNCVTLSVNKKEGYLTLTTVFEEDLLTAQVAKRAQDLLQETITTYKTKRAHDQLQFFENRYEEKKKEYQYAQSKLANYKDKNQFVTSALGSTEETRLQNDYNLAYSVYSELAKQLENAKIKEKKVTPVYVIIKPIVVPFEPFAPKKTTILMVSIILGVVLGMGYVFGVYFIKNSNATLFKARSQQL